MNATREILRTQHLRSFTVPRCSICEHFPEEIECAYVTTHEMIASYITTNMHLIIVEIFLAERFAKDTYQTSVSRPLHSNMNDTGLFLLA